MDDEARATGLDPLRARPRRRSPWGRRYPHAHHEGSAQLADRFAPTYAALDLGTNNCRLLVARPTAQAFRVIDAFSRIIRLGEGVSLSGRISEAAISRALEALSICRDKMQFRQVTRARLIATEACRAAANGLEFIERVRDKVELELEVIDRETEAELAATGCTPLIDPAADSVILFDIGGGSSELVSMASTRSPAGPPLPVIRAWMSLPVGVVTLAERHGGIDVGRALFEAMIAEVAVFVERFAALHHAGTSIDSIHLLGTSGTVTTIAGVHLGLKRYDRRQVDGCWMSDEQISEVVERLLAMSYAERVANACIGVERADLVLAGCAILEAIRRAFPCKRLRIADRGLREGMLVQMMREDRVWHGGR
jgi:exopolyphosphatase/guanosine-5'-triphosphate,3'-diphosphate pyrophosphatase